MPNDYHALWPAEQLSVPENLDDIDEILVRAAVSNEGVLAATTLHEQIGLLCDILRHYGEGVSYAKIGNLFSLPKSHATVKRHFEAWKKQPKEPKRLELLSQEVQHASL